MPSRSEASPVSVPCEAQQAGDARADLSRWAWVERCVWTERMLTALQHGVKGGKWFRLIDKVYASRTLRAASARVAANGGAAGVDHQTIAMFAARLDSNLEHLAEALRKRSYRPQAIRRVLIPKPGRREKRPLGIPTVRDRVAQTALRAVIEPIFEVGFAQHSYGFRPNRGCKDALRRVDTLLKRGYVWVVDADLRSYFDTIPHDRLMDRIGRKIADGRVLELIQAFLSQDVMETARVWAPQLDEGRGTPQGAVISPLLSNIYLDALDHEMAGAGFEMVRYADDFVILCRSQPEAQRALEHVSRWVEASGLTLHPDKTRIVDATQPGGFDFLGYHFEHGRHWPSRRSLKKFKDAIRAKTRRTNGRSLSVIVVDVNRRTRGWFEYFKHCPRTTHRTLDGWLRMRLRSILRRRQRRRGRGRGADHQRWPNAFFTAHGLFSMYAARVLVRQPACGQPPTGEPCAGDPHARFGGRGDREPNRSSLPL